MRYMTVVGARPQFIKAAALSAAIKRHNNHSKGAQICDIIVHTGQHYDYQMSDVFFEELGLPEPAYNLGVGSCAHGAQTGRMLEMIEGVIERESPDLVLVYGDTNSTLAGALAAAKLHARVAHVESGLRSFNRRMPEEINRVLTDHLSSWLFCPTATAVENLGREGIVHGVQLVGDVMYETLLLYAENAPAADLLASLGLHERGYALATVHRAENTDDPVRLASILLALSHVAAIVPVVCPLHPRTRAAVERLALGLPGALHLLPPLAYRQMLAAERDATLVLTDSGGVQKEAFWLGVPCVTLRDETEWKETVESGRNVLAGACCERIVTAASRLLQEGRVGAPCLPHVRAADAIVSRLLTDC
jgi:UDP-GlcNAc3NAcA epimerase